MRRESIGSIDPSYTFTRFSWVADWGAPLVVPFAYLHLARLLKHNVASAMAARDATYYYLTNAYVFARDGVMEYQPHPGAPLQWLGGVILKFAEKIDSTIIIEDHFFLRHHWPYLHLLNMSLVVFNFLCFALASLILRRRKANLLALVLAQLILLLAPGWIQFVGLFQPESAFLGMASLFLVLLTQHHPKPLTTGVVSSGLILTKFNWLAAALTLFLFKGAANKVRWHIYFAITSTILLFPMRKAFLSMIEMAQNNFLAKYEYNLGGMGVPGANYILSRIDPWLAFEIPIGITIIATGYVTSQFIRIRKENSPSNWLPIGIYLVSLLLFLKKPTHPYYFLPTTAALCFGILTYTKTARSRIATLILATLLASLNFYRSTWIIHHEIAMRADATAETAKLDDLLNSNKDCIVLAAPPIPAEFDALAMGGDWAGGRLSRSLTSTFSNVYFFTPVHHRIRQFTHSSTTLDTLLEFTKPTCVNIVLNHSLVEDIRKNFPVIQESKVIYSGHSFTFLRLDSNRKPRIVQHHEKR